MVNGRARPGRLSWLRQPAGLSRLDRALSERRGFPRPPLALSVRPARHADDRSARRRRCTRSRDRNAPASRCLPSGLAAIAAALLSVVRAGDHMLVTDSAYGPTRTFCDQILTRYGVTTTLFRSAGRRRDRRLDAAEHARRLSRIAGLAAASRCRTFRAIAAAAHAKGALVLMDNTWATPLYFRALDHRRRPVDPGRHQIYRRPLRRHARHGLRQCAATVAI